MSRNDGAAFARRRLQKVLAEHFIAGNNRIRDFLERIAGNIVATHCNAGRVYLPLKKCFQDGVPTSKRHKRAPMLWRIIS